MACPLTVLRQYNVNRKAIVETDDHVVFDDICWPKNARTSYLMYGTGKDNTANSYYTLGCLLYLLQNERLPHGAYVKKAMSDGVPIVRRPDRRELLAYLNGERATSSSIDRSAPLELPTRTVNKRRGAEVASSVTGAAKKPRLAVDKRAPTGDDPQVVAAKRPCLADPRLREAKDQLAAKLDAPREVTISTDNVKSLSEAMSVERIAEIKAKRLARKRATIRDYDEDVENADVGVNDSDTKETLARERHYRTRATILHSGGKEFLADVLNILKSVAIKERAAETGKVPAAPTPRPPPSPPKRQMAQAQGYNRYDQQRFVQHKEASEGFVIDTMKSYHGYSLKSVAESDVAQPKAAVPAAPTAPVKKKSGGRMPIIVIPSSESSLITTYNAADILQDLSFRTSAEKKARNARRENEVLLQRRKQGNLTVPYLVVDNPLRLTKADWDRVVAVFVMGPQWQFKGWPYDGNPVEIFARIPAFHLKFDEMVLEVNVAKWAVQVIELSKTRRHLDRAAISKFWEALDRHLVKNKPYLRY